MIRHKLSRKKVSINTLEQKPGKYMRLHFEVSFSLADQAMVSITNLSIGLFFIHYATKQDYAFYSIAFGLISLGIGFANALIYTPMLVTAAERSGESYERHCKSMLAVQFIMFGPALTLMGLVIATIYNYILKNTEMAYFSLAITVASLSALFHEFSRRYNFMKSNTAIVLVSDIIFCVCVLSLLYILWYLNFQRLFIYSVLAYGLAAIIAGMIGLRSAKLSAKFQGRDISIALKSAWQNGRWALGGVSVTWIQNQCYAYFLVISGAAVALADANAARLLLSPISLLSTSVMNVMMPRLARLNVMGDVKGSIVRADRIMLLMMCLLLGYTVLVYGFRDYIILFIFRGDYGDSRIFIIVWAIVILIQTARINTSALLQIFREFRSVTIANIWSALAVVVSTYAFISYFGPMGSILALAFGEFILTLLLWFALKSIKMQATAL